MKYGNIILYTTPAYIVLSAFVITATFEPNITRTATTIVFSAFTLVASIWMLVVTHLNKTLDPLIACNCDYDDDNVITGGINRSIGKRYKRSEIRKSRKEAAVISIYLPIILSWIVALTVTFSESLDLRYFEYASIYINYSVPFFISLLHAYVIKIWGW